VHVIDTLAMCRPDAQAKTDIRARRMLRSRGGQSVKARCCPSLFPSSSFLSLQRQQQRGAISAVRADRVEI